MKRIAKLLVVALVTGGGIYGLYSSNAQNELSELALANVDALATLTSNDCAKRDNATCYGLVYTAPPPSGSGGPAGPPSIDIERAPNQVNRAEAID